ncbi:MAG: hypothetical protein H6R18_1517 [Proteobacteria bacterium]|nr:hypothetical protein [Pseudomonadota bacterium]
MSIRMNRAIWALLMFSSCAATSLPALAADAGKVLTSQGVTTLQRAGTPARITGAGEALLVGDVLSTGPSSIAMIELADGSRMTLRPATVFTVEQFSIEAGKEAAVLRLFKGGLRALTGFISKRRPGSVSVATQTATIGIRGTDFDARLCSGKECQTQATAPAAKVLPIIARVALAKGKVQALSTDQQRRTLAAGDALYSGEMVETAASSLAVIAFADQTRLTLQADAQFRIEEFQFKGAAEEDRSVFRLFKGAMRMVTGLIGKANPKNVAVNTRVATIGIRGTGLDASCGGACAAQTPARGQSSPQSGLFLHTWSGATQLTTPQGTLALPAGSTGFVGAMTAPPVPLPSLPRFMANNPTPRPDTVPPPPPSQFGTGPGGAPQPPPLGSGSAGVPPPAGGQPTPPAGTPGAGGEGLHVWVREGEVTLQQGGQSVSLGAGQAGYAGPSMTQTPIMLPAPPVFMRLDPTPLPSSQSLPGSGSATLNRPGSTQSPTCQVR